MRPTTVVRDPAHPRQQGWRIGAGLLRSIGAFDQHSDRVETFARCDEEGLVIFASETYIRRPRLGDGDMFDLIAIGSEYEDASAREVEVPFIIERHPIRA